MTKVQRKYNAKFFPFSPGIPWKMERGKYVIPEIGFDIWHKVLNGKNIVVTAFGGLIESFFSLCAAEAISSFESSQKISWLGHSEYASMLRLQGLCKFSPIKLTPEVLKKYPVPLFIDNSGNAYLNMLHNYLIRTSYWGQYPEEVTSPVFEQISRNIMIPWQGYIPKLRNLGTELFDELYSTGKIRSTSKIVSIILNDVQNDILKWNVQNIKEFAQLASHKGWKVVVFTKNMRQLYGSNIILVEYNYNNIFQILTRSWVILSNDIDWLLISMLVSDAKIISCNIDNQYNLFKNAEFIDVHNDIVTSWNLMPVDIFRICVEL